MSQATAPQFAAESQKERWLKYGLTVILTVVIAVALLWTVLYIFRSAGRLDTTAGGVYSLKPQTVRLIQNLPSNVRIVGLLTKAKQASDRKVSEQDNLEVRYQQVADLLQEYQSKSGGKITVEMIDPVTEPAKVDALFNDVAKRYGNDVKKYDEVIQAYPKTIDQINNLANEEIEALKKLPRIGDNQDLSRTLGEVVLTIQIFPQILDGIRVDVKKQLELKVPDYKGASDAIRSGLEGLNERIDAVQKRFKTAAEDAKTPKEFKDYVASAAPRYEGMKKAADELLKKVEGLGSIKQLDELRQNKSNSIAVLGPDDIKVLPNSTIFKTENVRAMDADGKVKPRFAGEQQISTAIYGLTSKEKKKLAIIRSGGPPVALSLPMFNYEGFLSTVGERLRELNIEILEKDMSGQWAMQAMQMQMQGMPVPPEPNDEQLKDAVWIVMVTPQDPRQMMQNPQAGQLGMKVSEHLKNGGSAMLLFDVQTDKMEFLKEYGVEVRPDLTMVHEKIQATGARGEDPASDWQRQQPVFVLDNYGDHAVTRPLRSLDGLFVPLIPVKTVEAKGVTVTPLLPIPTTPKAWAESDFDSLRQGKLVEYSAKKKDEEKEADMAAPLWGGAAVEKSDKGQRILVLGCRTFAANDNLSIPDFEVMRNQQRLVPRFPGNAELFVNSVYWLTKMDTMIAISPTAFDVPRVSPVNEGLLNFWRFGVMIAGLPILVLAAGTFVWLKRRD